MILWIKIVERRERQSKDGRYQFECIKCKEADQKNGEAWERRKEICTRIGSSLVPSVYG